LQKIGKVLKAGKAFKYSDDVAELVSDGKILKGKVKMADDSTVEIAARMSESGNNLTLSEVYFFQRKGDEYFGAENQRKLGSMPLKILSDIKKLAKESGYDQLTLKFKRVLYNDAGDLVYQKKELKQLT